MSSPQRSALLAEPLTRALVHRGGLWNDVRVVQETGSTNEDLLAGGGAPSGSVLVAEEQTAGRGRQGREWSSPPGSGLTFSVLLRPGEVEVSRWPFLPLLAGMALASAITRICALCVRLKWPNDLLVMAPEGEPRKLAGVLTERSGEAVVIGVGLNVSTTASELPYPAATSLAMENFRWVSRQELLIATLRELETTYLAWLRERGDPEASGARSAYRHMSATLGQQVRIQLPGGGELHGLARDVDGNGRLVLDTDADAELVSAGDVTHVR